MIVSLSQTIYPTRLLCLLLLCPLALTLSTSAFAVDFGTEVYPILQRHCVECHGAEKQEGGLRLDIRQEALESGSIDAGSPDDSELIRRMLLPKNDEQRMPAVGEPVPKEQIETLRAWIASGASWPEDFESAKHWAYVAPQRPIPPSDQANEWAKTPIDHFVLSRLAQKGIAPSPKADPEKLIRRVFLDLIGLPPTPAEVQAFIRDPSDRHFELIVDELLGRPQFGERWARHWLDLARYADSHGFQRDNFRDVWAYRDWVIRALNEDMPFDRFTIEQVAGDLLPDATESQLIATGFHRCTPTNVEAGSLPEETRVEQVIDRVNTTGAVWLGTTLECCQCHDHKYDPFSSKEYYQLLAYFNNTQREADRTNPKTPSSIQFKGPSMPLSDPERDEQRKRLQQQLAGIKAEQTLARKKLQSGLEQWIPTLKQEINDSPQTTTLDVTAFESQGTTDSYKKLDDGSVLLVGGDPPDKDVYQIEATTQLDQITGIRLDALVDDSLPEKGPGRSERRNFVLNEFEVALVSNSTDEDAASADAPTERLEFISAKASFSQKKWDVAGAVDGKPKSGWAISPQQGKSHWATFKLKKPINVGSGQSLSVTLRHQFGRATTIGRLKLSAITGRLDSEPVPAAVIAATEKPAKKWNKKDRKALTDFRINTDAAYAKLTREANAIQKQIDQITPDTTLVMVELDEPRMSTTFERGDYRNPGEPVQAGTPEVLHATPTGPPNRLTLAKWLVASDNPIVARVTVNRWWAEIFGRGIVTTPEDFGIKGDLPSHPQLLDWLAVELMENGWSMKHLLKSIVCSATYQQSSTIRHDLLEVDANNRLLARGPRYRMDAEMIRDNALAIAGLLNLKPYGPSIRPYQPDGIWSKVGGESYAYEVSPGSEQHRRGIYVVIKRGSPYPSFINFDATARLACTVKRSRTNTPLQALTLLNDPVYVEAAQSLAQRIKQDCAGQSIEEQINYGFQLCTARSPNDSEKATLMHLYREQAEADDPMYGIATVLLNLHETITKD